MNENKNKNNQSISINELDYTLLIYSSDIESKFLIVGGWYWQTCSFSRKDLYAKLRNIMRRNISNETMEFHSLSKICNI